MQETVDVEAYLARIGGVANAAPDLRTLRDIVRQHTHRIAFENLNALLGWPVRLELKALEQKLVLGGRGGYCFEQNLLLKAVLASIGFRVTGLAARVVWNSDPGVLANPRTHMLIRVEMETGSYLVDVGFGVLTPTGVLKLQADIEQATPHETYRLRKADAEFVLEASLGGEWKALYRFDLQAQLQQDYEVSNWWVSTHPRSHFTQNLIAARPDEGRRYTLSNCEFTMRSIDGAVERRQLASTSELRDVLENVFRIVLPEASELDPVLSRIVSSALVIDD